MRRFFFATFVTVNLLASSIAQATLVSGFEAPDADAADGFVDLYTGPVSFIDTAGSNAQWSVQTGFSVEVYDEAFAGGGGGLLTPFGSQFLDVNGSGAGRVVAPVLLAAGIPHILSFSYADHPFRDVAASGVAAARVSLFSPGNGMLASVVLSRDLSVAGSEASMAWQPFVHPLIVPTVSELALLTVETTTPAGMPLSFDAPHGILLDDVFVGAVAIPEARAWMCGVLVCGIMVVTYFVRRLARTSTLAAV